MNLLSIALRFFSLASKFGLIFILAKFLAVEEFGKYSLISTTIALSIYLIGLDVYTYSNRKLVSLNSIGKEDELKRQLALYFFTNLIAFFPLFFTLTEVVHLNVELSLLVCLLVVVEHLSLEVSRVLIALGCLLKASVVIFIRTGAWCILLIMLFVVEQSFRSLNVVIAIWLLATFSSLVVGVKYIGTLNFIKFWQGGVNIEWVRDALKVAFPFLLATIQIRILFAIDRYIVEYYDGLDIVAVYGIYIGICTALVALLEVVVFQAYYPKLIKHFDTKSPDFNRCIKQFSTYTVVVLLFLLLIASFLVEFFLGSLPSERYLKEIDCFWIILLAHVFLSLSYIPHYILYSMRLDRYIILSGTLAFVFFFISLLIFGGGIKGVAVSMVISFFVLFLSKLMFLRSNYTSFNA